MAPRQSGDISKEFYQGDTAKRTVDYSKANGGLFSAEDLSRFEAHEDTPIRVNYRGIDVYECPPNSQGHVMLQALQILEGFDLRYMGHNSARYLHLVTEALKLSFADRNRYVGDPGFVGPIPMDELLSDAWADRRRAAIDPDHAIAGEPLPGELSGETTDDVNVLVPGKRTRHTINPAIALKNGKPFVVFGTPGADTQPRTQLQFFLNVVEFGMNLQQALEAPAVISTSFKSSYFPHNADGTLRVPAMLRSTCSRSLRC